MPVISNKIKVGTILRFKKCYRFYYETVNEHVSKIEIFYRGKNSKPYSSAFFTTNAIAETLKWDGQRELMNLMVFGIYSSAANLERTIALEEVSHARMASDFRIYILIQFPSGEFSLIPGKALRYVG